MSSKRSRPSVAPSKSKRTKTGKPKKKTPEQKAYKQCGKCKTKYKRSHKCRKRKSKTGRKSRGQGGRNRGGRAQPSGDYLVLHGEHRPAIEEAARPVKRNISSVPMPGYDKIKSEPHLSEGNSAEESEDVERGEFPTFLPTDLPFTANNLQTFEDEDERYSKRFKAETAQKDVKIEREPASGAGGESDGNPENDPCDIARLFAPKSESSSTDNSSDLFVFQLPAHLPILHNPKAAVKSEGVKIKPEVTANSNINPGKLEALEQVNSEKKKNLEEENATNILKVTTSLDNVPAGVVGKMIVRKSGRVQLLLGDVLLDLHKGAPAKFFQEVGSMDHHGNKRLYRCGPVKETLTTSFDIRQIAETTEPRTDD